jgi:hypothetical protein
MCDTVEHDVTGLFADNDRDYMRHVVALLRNPSRAATLGARAPAWIYDRFNFNSVCAAWMRELDSAIAGIPPACPAETTFTGRYPSASLRRYLPRSRLSYRAIDFIERVHGWYIKKR